MNKLLDGKDLARQLRGEVSASAEALHAKGITPKLAVVVATTDEQTTWYVDSISRAASACGIEANIVRHSPEVTELELAAELTKLAQDPEVHGLILQTPLPPHVHAEDLISLIPIDKDIDGVNPVSTGRLVSGLPAFIPATAAAVMLLLEHYRIPLKGKHAVVVGRSRVVGLPVAHVLLKADATVTICHSKTADLAAITRQADILIAAAGKPKLITADHLKEGTIVIDVGTSPDEQGNIVGDVDAEQIINKAGALTPVPGGVGPVTTALLLQQVITAVSHPFV